MDFVLYYPYRGDMMIYTLLEFHGFSKIVYAHSHTANDYKYTVDTGNGVIEIGIVEENPIIFTDFSDGCEYTAEIGDVFILSPMNKYGVRTKKPGIHRHITVEAAINSTVISRSDAPSELSDRQLCLPLIVRAADRGHTAESLIRRIVYDFTCLAERNFFTECGMFMQLVGKLNRTKEKSGTLSPSALVYCRQAEKYVADNLCKKLTLTEIADHIGISKNYLTNIFSQNRGMPLIEYINRMKLNHILELMLRFNYGIRQAGEYVGMDDPNYVSRLFKSYYGVTLSEYKNMHFGN